MFTDTDLEIKTSYSSTCNIPYIYPENSIFLHQKLMA